MLISVSHLVALCLRCKLSNDWNWTLFCFINSVADTELALNKYLLNEWILGIGKEWLQKNLRNDPCPPAPYNLCEAKNILRQVANKCHNEWGSYMQPLWLLNKSKTFLRDFMNGRLLIRHFRIGREQIWVPDPWSSVLRQTDGILPLLRDLKVEIPQSLIVTQTSPLPKNSFFPST